MGSRERGDEGKDNAQFWEVPPEVRAAREKAKAEREAEEQALAHMESEKEEQTQKWGDARFYKQEEFEAAREILRREAASRSEAPTEIHERAMPRMEQPKKPQTFWDRLKGFFGG